MGPLADNGGPTLTHAIKMNSSVAIDMGGTCPFLNTDQRGVDRSTLLPCDIGAFEVTDFDGDSFLDTVDVCIDSDLCATVKIGTCNSGVDNQMLPAVQGCTIKDLIVKCAQTFKRRNKRLKCVKNVLQTLVQSGVITNQDKMDIRGCFLPPGQQPTPTPTPVGVACDLATGVTSVTSSCGSLAGCAGGNTRTICDVSDISGGADGTAVCKAHNAGDEETLDCCWTDPTSAGVVTNGACNNPG